MNQELHDAAKQVASQISDEVVRATVLHGKMNGRHEAYAVILEELDEFWDLVKLNPAKMSIDEVEVWQSSMRKELTQTAAMCIKTIVNLGL